jgi:hypothetical protein
MRVLRGIRKAPDSKNGDSPDQCHITAVFPERESFQLQLFRRVCRRPVWRYPIVLLRFTERDGSKEHLSAACAACVVLIGRRLRVVQKSTMRVGVVTTLVVEPRPVQPHDFLGAAAMPAGGARRRIRTPACARVERGRLARNDINQVRRFVKYWVIL